MSMKIDRIKDDKISWSDMYGDPGTAQYHTLEDEVNYAVRCRDTTSLFSIRDFTITTSVFSCLKEPTSTFTFKTLIRHYSKRALTHGK